MNTNSSTVFLLAFLGSAQLLAEALPTYKGQIRLPVDLYTREGTRIGKGGVDVEVREEKGLRVLILISKALGITVSVAASPANEESEPSVDVPIVGTVLLRSSSEPTGTEEERQYTKTGRPQYQDQNRDWKRTLRVYRSEDSKSTEVYFILEERPHGPELSQTRFKLFLRGEVVDRKSDKPSVSTRP